MWKMYPTDLEHLWWPAFRGFLGGVHDKARRGRRLAEPSFALPRLPHVVSTRCALDSRQSRCLLVSLCSLLLMMIVACFLCLFGNLASGCVLVVFVGIAKPSWKLYFETPPTKQPPMPVPMVALLLVQLAEPSLCGRKETNSNTASWVYYCIV